MEGGKKGALVHQLVHQKSRRVTETLIIEPGGFQEEQTHRVQERTGLIKGPSPLLGLTGRKKVFWMV